MSVLSAPAPSPKPRAKFNMHLISVDDYHKMIQYGILGEQDPVELIEGLLVQKMPRNPAHDGTIQVSSSSLLRILPDGWVLRIQSAVTLSDSEPEPDICAARGHARSFLSRHPGPADVGLIVEVAESSLDWDREEKSRVFARAAIPQYWVINLVDRQVEVFTNPSGPTPAPSYANHQVLLAGSSVTLILDGSLIGTIPIAELLP